MPNFASQIRVAFSSIASNTGSSSPGELEMTCNTSEVAVCCSSASDSSRVRACTSSNSRTFSIAITAWSAKVVTSSICLSVNGRTVRRVSTITPIGIPSRSSGTPSTVRSPPASDGIGQGLVPGSAQNVGDLDGFALEHRSPGDRASIRLRTGAASCTRDSGVKP